MDRNKILILVGLFAIIAAGLIYRSYSLHRTPVDMSQDTNETSVADRDVQTTDGTRHTVPLDQIVAGGPPKDGIPSIDNPKFESTGAADRYLKNDGFGLSVEVDGEYRYYPYQILVWHEIVNDTFNDKPLLVTYCPLCFTGIVFERTVDGEPVAFGTSGKLWNSNLVMYDRKTDSYWSQVMGESIVGPKAGTRLKHYPAETIRWDEWRDEHPDGEVLSRDTGIRRDYTRDPYGNYYENQDVMFPLTNNDDRLSVKTRIFGVRINDQRKAYPWSTIENERLIEDTVGGEPILIVYDEDSGSSKGFKRTLDGEVLDFRLDDGVLKDVNTDSEWSFDGEAVGGELQGETLEPIVLEGGYWFSWAAAFPQTELYNQN
jgi:hypothetical protein